MIAESISSPAMASMTEEVAGVRAFLKKVQDDDDRAQERLLASLQQMQDRLQIASSRLNAVILQGMVKGLVERYEKQVARLRDVREHLYAEFSRRLNAEAKKHQQELLRKKARLEFEQAKIMDAKSYKEKAQ